MDHLVNTHTYTYIYQILKGEKFKRKTNVRSVKENLKRKEITLKKSAKKNIYLDTWIARGFWIEHSTKNDDAASFHPSFLLRRKRGCVSPIYQFYE